MSENLTHTIIVTVNGRYPHGNAERASVTIAGQGDIDHWLDAFRAALVAGGFSAGLAARLDLDESKE